MQPLLLVVGGGLDNLRELPGDSPDNASGPQHRGEGRDLLRSLLVYLLTTTSPLV